MDERHTSDRGVARQPRKMSRRVVSVRVTDQLFSVFPLRAKDRGAKWRTCIDSDGFKDVAHEHVVLGLVLAEQINDSTVQRARQFVEA